MKKCENCKWNRQKKNGVGSCVKIKRAVPLGGWCIEYEEAGASKAKPHRLCDFCERGKRMNSEVGEHDLKLVKFTPVSPIIDLTSQNMEEIKLGKPFYAMFMHDPEYGDEAATFQINYCPFCGRKLVGE